MKQISRAIGCALLLWIGFGTEAFAQTARVSGRVVDASEGHLPGVTVTIVNEATGLQRTGVSNADGYYSITTLPPGPYRMTTQMSGFADLTRDGLTLVADQSARIDFNLSVAGLTTELTVTADQFLESQTATLATAVTERSIRELPLNVRDPMGLVVLTPGVVTGGLFGNTGTLDVGRSFFKSDFKIAGGRNDAQDILLDGASNVTGDRNFMGYIPSVDATQEFKVEINPFSAEYGRTTGGAVTIVTKAGGNDFSGTLYEFHRNSSLDEQGYFAKKSNQPRLDFSRNQFGGVIGGPIRKDKTFFFAAYEGLRQSYPQTLISTVPTELQRRGDFSQTRDSQGRLIVIYDPLSGTTVRQPFPGNVIPAGRLDPVAVKVMSFYPPPNQPGNAVTGQNNFIFDGSQKADSNNYSFRLDHSLGTYSRVFARYSQLKSASVAPPRWDLPSARDLRDVIDTYYNVTIGGTHVLSSTVTADLRIGFARAFAQQISPAFDVAQLGFPSNYLDVAPDLFPYFDISDVQGIGSSLFNDQPRNTYSVLWHVDKVAGSHMLRIGGDVRVLQFNAFQNNQASGRFTFDRLMTQGPNANQATSNGGYGLASFLLGAGTSGLMDHISGLALQRNYYAGYVQDDWKVTPRLTANLGLRYEVTMGPTERFDRLASMDLESPSPLGNVGNLNLRGQLQYAGNGNPRTQIDTDWNNIGPRLGLAYQVGDRTALRAGYGVFYVPMATLALGSIGFNSNTPWVATVDNLTPQNYLQNPFPQGFNLPQERRDPLANVGFAITGHIRDERVGYTQQWSLSLQHQIGANLIDIAYVGNKGTSLPFGRGFEENTLPLQHLALGAALNERVPNPFLGIIRTGALSGATVTRRQLLLPYPQYTSVLRDIPMAASSIYHGVMIKAERRVSKGLTMLASYTFSKQIEDSSASEGFLDRPGSQGIVNFYDRPSSERSLSSFDTPHRAVISVVYDVPLGRGRGRGENMPKALDLLIGGWTVSGIGTYQSGLPIIVSRPAVRTGTDASLDNAAPERWFDITQFTAAPAFTFGNVGRNLSDVRTDSLRNVDLTLGKYLSVGRDVRLQLRADAFNLFNTTRFGAPNGTVTNAAFGTVTTQANSPREIQLGVKLYW